MSNTSTADELESNAQPWGGACWRVVESQSQISTMKLVDTLDQQNMLEDIIDRSKPKYPPACEGMNWLIASPFRYWPYLNGSRFRRQFQTDGCLYASDSAETAIAEFAFYRLLFFMESPELEKANIEIEATAFSVQIETRRSIDLTRSPFSAKSSVWMDPNNYDACQELADLAREKGIQAIRYRSVRDPQQGMNIALFSPQAVSSREPIATQTWKIFLSNDAAQVFREMTRKSLEFKFSDWAKDIRVRRYIGNIK